MVSLCVSQTHLPRGSSPSSLRHLTVGAGSPCTSHRKSTLSSSITTWFTGLRNSTGRSAKTGTQSRQETGHVITHAHTRRCQRRHTKRQQNTGAVVDFRPTIHHKLCGIAVSLAHHVGANTHIHASVTLPGVGDHQLAPTHLRRHTGTHQVSSTLEEVLPS